MTTEDDFQKALDKKIEDWQTRLVFADWLEERGDVRAEGYRALGLLQRFAFKSGSCKSYGGVRDHYYGFTHASNPAMTTPQHEYRVAALPDDWYAELRPANALPKWSADHWAYLVTRREAEDAAALAFAKLPATRRAELLARAGSDEK